MMKSYHITCPKCNNNHSFYRYGKDPDGYQKYLCRNCHHQFAPERPRTEGANCRRKYPPCPVCGKTSFLHHDFMSIIPITVVVTRSVTILSWNGSPLPLPLRLCHPFLESIILSVCVIPYKLLSWLCQCFILAKTLSAISV